jgi:hypothetical protein
MHYMLLVKIISKVNGAKYIFINNERNKRLRPSRHYF